MWQKIIDSIIYFTCPYPKLVGLDNILQKYTEIHKYSIKLENRKKKGKITYIVFLLLSIFLFFLFFFENRINISFNSMMYTNRFQFMSCHFHFYAKFNAFFKSHKHIHFMNNDSI